MYYTASRGGLQGGFAKKPSQSRFRSPAPPEGEPLAGRTTSYWTPKARYGAKGRALLTGTAASGQRSLSSCRWPRQRSTTVPEKIRLCSSRVGLTGTPEAPPFGELSPKVTERARMLTVIRGRSDSIALTKSLLIAAWAVLSRRACPLRRFAPALPKGEPYAPHRPFSPSHSATLERGGWGLCGRSSISMCCFW